METINLKLTVEETNKILQSLGSLPYLQVHQLIHKLQYQAGEQLNDRLATESETEQAVAEAKK
ncbi:hypothetical protein [Ekhidna sp.]